MGVPYPLCSFVLALTAVARQRTDQLCGRDRSVLLNNGHPVFRGLCQTALLLGRILPLRIREGTRNDTRHNDRSARVSDSIFPPPVYQRELLEKFVSMFLRREISLRC